MKKIIKIGFSFNFANGGPSNFLKKLNNALIKNKICRTSYFLNPFTDCNIYANKVRNPWSRPYIFRIDGIGHDISKTQDFSVALNNQISNGINNAIGVVYQTEYSKKLSSNLLEINNKNNTVILNGTNLSEFCSKGNNYRSKLGISDDAVVFITSAKWRPRKRLQHMINVFLDFKEKYIGETFFIIVGNSKIKDIHENVIRVPEIKNEELPAYLRTANIYLFLGWLDPCPNSVVEAIACGLPVICSNSGGTPEIIEATKGGIIVDADKDYDYKFVNLQEPPKPDYEKIINAMTQMTADVEFYKNQIDTTKIDINYVAASYYRFIEECYEK
jgi:glycosyltransferase involved in cell wall biosynthesis